eukprot:m.96914 g.96914  ORF g.96914 m.96914 type:complete len:490 (-) comp22008_c0_seq3:18-1487(-)
MPLLFLLFFTLVSASHYSSKFQDSYCANGACTSQMKFLFPHSDPHRDYNKIGISKASAGNAAEGLEYFRAAALFSPFRGDLWANIGLALTDVAREKLSHSPAESLPLLREALAAFDVGIMLQNGPATRLRQESVSLFKKHHKGKCREEGSNCQRARLEAKAWKLREEFQHIKAVNILCADVNHLKVSLSKHEHEQGLLTAFTARRLFIITTICGVVSLEKIFPASLILDVHKQQEKDFQEFYANADKLNDQNVRESTEAAERAIMRYEVKFPIREPYVRPDFTANRFLLSFVKLLLTNKIEIDTFSHVTSLPGAPDQEWHNDVDSLFSRVVVTEEKALPPQALVVVVPLVDMTQKVGPTEFMCGSHLNLGIDFWKNKDGAPETPLHRIEAETGSVVVFDVRIRHRGTANKSDQRRPIVYMSYSYQWFHDKVNFKDRQTSAFDELPPSIAKLFMRLDAHRYTTMLESLVDPQELEQLRSKKKYKKVDMSA